jgi:hypothetical protein
MLFQKNGYKKPPNHNLNQKDGNHIFKTQMAIMVTFGGGSLEPIVKLAMTFLLWAIRENTFIYAL